MMRWFERRCGRCWWCGGWSGDIEGAPTSEQELDTRKPVDRSLRQGFFHAGAPSIQGTCKGQIKPRACATPARAGEDAREPVGMSGVLTHGSSPLVTHRPKFLRNSRDRSREIIGLWSPLRRCHIHRMEEMLNAGGWSFKLEEMWLFWIVFSQATNYTPGYQCLQVSTEQIKSCWQSQASTNKRSTSQDFIYQPLQILVTACPNLLGSALHGIKNTWSLQVIYYNVMLFVRYK